LNAVPAGSPPAGSLAERHPTLSGTEIVDHLVPPRQFRSATVDSYRPDADYPSQAAAVEAVRSFATAWLPSASRFFSRRKSQDALPGIYLDGGRAEWELVNRAPTTEIPVVTPVEYPVVERDDSTDRAYREDVLAHFGKPLIDVRSPEEYSGERTEIPGYPTEGALRAGHIPSAASVPWARAAAPDATFKPREELEAIYHGEAGLQAGDDVIAYCRIGERSSHSWFVLKYLLGFENVRNYDGAWTEWGSAGRVPIATGSEPGEVPAR
jgi:rhodanese-related sulfurtransferase